MADSKPKKRRKGLESSRKKERKKRTRKRLKRKKAPQEAVPRWKQCHRNKELWSRLKRHENE